MRTVIMADRNTTIDPRDLERFGTITLVGLPSSAAKTRPQLGRGSWGRSLKVPMGDRHDSDVGSPSAYPIKILREGGLFQLAASVFSSTVSLAFSVLHEPK
jgi:hypothetical protein